MAKVEFDIGIIRKIRTEQKTNTETHGTTQRQMSELYGSDELHGNR